VLVDETRIDLTCLLPHGAKACRFSVEIFDTESQTVTTYAG